MLIIDSFAPDSAAMIGIAVVDVFAVIRLRNPRCK